MPFSPNCSHWFDRALVPPASTDSRQSMQLPAVLLHRGTQRPQRAVWNRTIRSTDGAAAPEKGFRHAAHGHRATVRCIANAVTALIFPQRFTLRQMIPVRPPGLCSRRQGGFCSIKGPSGCRALPVNADSLGDAILLFYFFPANAEQSGIFSAGGGMIYFFAPNRIVWKSKKPGSSRAFLLIYSIQIGGCCHRFFLFNAKPAPANSRAASAAHTGAASPVLEFRLLVIEALSP